MIDRAVNAQGGDGAAQDPLQAPDAPADRGSNALTNDDEEDSSWVDRAPKIFGFSARRV